jgi:transcriptional regulator with XRE-family HTH domain
MKGVTSPDVGRALRVARERAGLGQGPVARASGLTAGELQSIEAGEAHPSIAVLQRLASAVGASLLEVVRRADGKSPASPRDGIGRNDKSAARLDGNGRNDKARIQAPAAVPTSSTGIEALARAILELPPNVGSKIEAVASATVLRAMAVCRNNQSAAARLLGMERKAFVRRLQRARRRRK